MSIRDKFFEDQAKASLWDVAVSIKRGNPLPLDANAVYASYGELLKTEIIDEKEVKTYTAGSLLEYAKTNPVAYPGQICAVVGETETSIYYLDQNLEIQPVGIIPTGDSKSITVTSAGLVSIVGADTADGLTVPRMKSDKSGLEWVALTDANDDTTYEIKALTKTTGEGESQVTETFGITVKPLFNGEPIVDEETGNEIVTDIPFDVYTKSEVDAAIREVTEYVDEEIGKKIHIRTEVVTEVPAVEDAEEGVIYLVADENSAAGTYLEYILVEKDGQKSVEQIGDTTTDLSNYYNKDEIDGFFEALPEDEDTTYTISAGTTNDKVKVILTSDKGAEQPAEIDAYNTATIDKMLYEGSYTGKEGEVVSNITENKDKARLLSSEEIKKLSALVIDEDGTVGISGTVSADNVTGLPEFIKGQVTGDGGLGIEENAEVNIIEIVKVNGKALEPDTNRAVDIDIPTKLSELEDDIAHVSDVVVKATQRDGDGTVIYESKLTATRTAKTNVITLDDSALQDAINAVNDNVVHSISVNNTPVNADSQHHVNITATTGSQNGAIAIAGKDVLVKGLKSAAFADADEFKTVQTAVDDPTAIATDASTISFIDSIAQDTNGVITPTKKSYDLKTNIIDPLTSAIDAIYKVDGNTKSGELATQITRIDDNAAAIKAIYYKKDADTAAEGLLATAIADIDASKTAIATLVGTTANDDKKSVRAIATEVANAAIGSAGHLKREIVTELPAVENADADTIYMVKTYDGSRIIEVSTIEPETYCDGSVGETLSTFSSEENDIYIYTVQPNHVYILQEYAASTNATAYFVGDGSHVFTGEILAVHDIRKLTSLTAPKNAKYLVVNTAINTPPVVSEGTLADAYKEYMLIDGAFAQIGDTSVNLDGYATEEFVTDLVNNTTPAKFADGVLGTIKGATDVTIDDEVVADRNAVYARESGVGEVRALSTDILVNGTKTLILNGGHAEI